MIGNKILRSVVTVTTHSPYGGIYECTEDPEVFIINLCQKICWYDGHVLCEIVRKVPHKVDNPGTWKKGDRMPGNIAVAYTTEAIGYEDDHLCLDEQGQPVLTPDGYHIYNYYWYDCSSKYQPEGVLLQDDDLSELTGEHNQLHI